MLKAIREFNRLGRLLFLRRYGFSRASKFYLIHAQRLYDTKPLVAAAYRYAKGRRLAPDDFGGGAQTLSVVRSLAKQDKRFERSECFADKLGELRNLSAEFDRLPRLYSDLRKLGFSDWIPLFVLTDLQRLHTRRFPGVYAIATSPRRKIIDARVVYIGETVDQNLYERLKQFLRSATRGTKSHSGGRMFWERKRRKQFDVKKLWLAIRSFPLGYGLEEEFANSFRSSQIRLLERVLLHEYVLTNKRYPVGNLK